MYAYASSVPCLLYLPFYHWSITIDIVLSNGEGTRPRARTKSRQPPLAGGTASLGGATQSRRSHPGSPVQRQCPRARAAAEALPSQGLVAEWCRAMIWVVPLSGQLHRASAPRAAQRSAAGTPPSRRSQDVCSLKRSSRACAARCGYNGGQAKARRVGNVGRLQVRIPSGGRAAEWSRGENGRAEFRGRCSATSSAHARESRGKRSAEQPLEIEGAL